MSLSIAAFKFTGSRAKQTPNPQKTVRQGARVDNKPLQTFLWQCKTLEILLNIAPCQETILPGHQVASRIPLLQGLQIVCWGFGVCGYSHSYHVNMAVLIWEFIGESSHVRFITPTGGKSSTIFTTKSTIQLLLVPWPVPFWFPPRIVVSKHDSTRKAPWNLVPIAIRCY